MAENANARVQRSQPVQRRSGPVRHEPDDLSGAEQLVRGLQAAAGNQAVAQALGGPAVQRQGGSAGRRAAGSSASNPVVAAMWKSSVVDPIHNAANDLVDEPPGYRDAFDLTKRAADGVDTVNASLPEGDPRHVKANYLNDDLRLVLTLLAPRANVTIDVSDDRIASQLGGLEYNAQVVGESVGGEAAPRQVVNPKLGQGGTPEGQ